MSGLTELALAIVLGGAFAAGLVLVSTRIPRLAAPTLSRRIAPYLRDVADPRGLTPLASVSGDWRARRDRLIASLGGAARIEHRLRQAGWTQDAASFRARQLTWVVVGALLGGWLGSVIFGVGLEEFWSLQTWLVAIGGAIIVLLIYGLIVGRGGKARN